MKYEIHCTMPGHDKPRKARCGRRVETFDNYGRAQSAALHLRDRSPGMRTKIVAVAVQIGERLLAGTDATNKPKSTNQRED